MVTSFLLPLAHVSLFYVLPLKLYRLSWLFLDRWALLMLIELVLGRMEEFFEEWIGI